MREMRQNGALAGFLNRLAQAGRGMLLLDYDGTLAPFCAQRDAALPYPGVREALAELMLDGRTRVVVVSGRPTLSLIPLLDLHPQPEIWGCHGAERLWPTGRYDLLGLDDAATAGLEEATRVLLDHDLQRHCEPKPAGVAWHTRGLSPSEIEAMSRVVLPAWRAICDRAGLVLLPFDGGQELLIAGVGKGWVVQRLLDEADPDHTTAFLGDDQADEAAFQALASHGLSVLVRPQWRPTAADVWLEPPAELLDFLTAWRQAVAGEGETETDRP